MKVELHRQQLRMMPQASLPAPPAVGARVDPPAHGHKASGLTFESAKNYLPAWAVKSLRTQAPPIADDTIPEPTSLRSFWERVDHAMQSLDPSFENY